MAIRPGKYNPLKPDIELLDFKTKKRFGLKIEGNGMSIGTVSQDDTVHIRAAGKRVGDFDEQRSWKAGRGKENLSSDPEGFWDSMNAWTLSDGHITPTLLWRMARGVRECEFTLPSPTASVTWQALMSTTFYIDLPFVSTGVVSADYLRLWIRRVGNPGTLTVNLCSDSAGVPGSTLKTATVTTADITDVVSVFQKFDWTGTQTLTAGTTYHIEIYGEATDNHNNHWEVGGNSSGTAGLKSTNGSSWTSLAFDMYYYIADADVERWFFPFTLGEAMFLCERRSDGGNSRLFINGDIGTATATTSNTLTCSGKSWTTNRWAGAFVKIIGGTGAGLVREILSNNATVLTVSSWGTTLDTTSQFIIYATEWFTEITSTGLGFVWGPPVVVNNVVYFPQGGTNIRNMIWSGTGFVFGDDGTNKAHYLQVLNVAGQTMVAKAYNDSNAKTVALALPQVWANPPPDLTYGSTVSIGDSSSRITGLNQKDGYLYVFKSDGVWGVDKDLRIISLNSGLDKTPSQYNGIGNINAGQFMYFSWLHSLIRIYGSNFDDIGQDWSGYGLPDGREGVFYAMDNYTSLLMCAVDAGANGTSSVLGFDGVGWHEMFRAYDVGKIIRTVKVQVCEGTRNRTWISVGGDLVYQEMPFMKGTPRLDSGARYQHEAVVESSIIDMGTAATLRKFIKELTVFCKNLGDGNEICVDYQVDNDVHTAAWTYAGTLGESPESSVFLGLDDVSKLVYRLRIRTATNSNPVDILGVVPNGYARVPYKMAWTLRCRADNITSRGRLAKPDELLRWLLDNARFPGRVMMLSQFELAHKFFVIIHPAQSYPYKPAADGMAEESVFTIVLEEA